MLMVCRIADLRHKEVINSVSGTRIGFVDDVEVDTVSSCIKSIIIYGRPRCMGLLGRNDDYIVPWCDIELIGEDTILVTSDVKTNQKQQKQSKLFG